MSHYADLLADLGDPGFAVAVAVAMKAKTLEERVAELEKENTNLRCLVDAYELEAVDGPDEALDGPE